MQLDPSQQRAVELVCAAPLGIITGGPGTGKTTCLRQALDRIDAQGVTYALASPTGKAARRMSEATGREASTIHRLLEYRPGMGFTRDERNPLEVDLVVVDEASMLDTELAAALMGAIQAPTRLVLVGDADQLPSVGPGRVFADLIESERVPVARLTTLHRAAAESWVCSQSREILAGRVPDLTERADFWWVGREDRDASTAALVEVVTQGLPELGVPRNEAQVLIPQNVGAAGAVALNRRIKALVNPRDGGGWKVGDVRIHRGDAVIQTRNDYHLDGGRGVMNGECGTVEALENTRMWVRFDDRDTAVPYCRDGARALRLAYALTTHKAQGSEWPWVVVLCHSTHTRMLSRRWLYTAVTRARRGVVLVGDRQGLERAVRNDRDGARNSGLVGRLRESRGGSEVAA